MNTLKLEVVRFDAEDVIATSWLHGSYFTTKSEYSQADPSHVYSDSSADYVWLWGTGENTAEFDGETYSAYGKYAWYDAKTDEWHTNNKDGGYYYNYDTSTYNFPTGKD